MKSASKLTSAQFRLNDIRSWCYQAAICLFFTLSLACSVSCLNVLAQTNDATGKNESYSISFGFGLSKAGNGDLSKAGGGISHRIALDYQVKRFVLSAFITGNQGGKVNYEEYLKNTSNSPYLDYDFKHEWFWDLGLQVGGVALQSNRVSIAVMTGLSFVVGERIVIKENNSFFSSPDFNHYKVARKLTTPSMGLPLDAKVHFKITDELGIGLCAHANFNQVENFFGITLNLAMVINKADNM